MDLVETLEGRLRVYPFGVDAVAALARGDIALAVSLASEILGRPDVTFGGCLPEPFQAWTLYRAVPISERAAGRRFLDELAGANGNEALQRVGFAR